MYPGLFEPHRRKRQILHACGDQWPPRGAEGAAQLSRRPQPNGPCSAAGDCGSVPFVAAKGYHVGGERNGGRDRPATCEHRLERRQRRHRHQIEGHIQITEEEPDHWIRDQSSREGRRGSAGLIGGILGLRKQLSRVLPKQRRCSALRRGAGEPALGQPAGWRQAVRYGGETRAGGSKLAQGKSNGAAEEGDSRDQGRLLARSARDQRSERNRRAANAERGQRRCRCK
mmetsp:Transcript_109654/g.318625  ORF Transcript_109654/g.318625 Transcript_109654/m.318625 type:complete len:228 (-) Transcript_109654:1092-1775(-)